MTSRFNIFKLVAAIVVCEAVGIADSILVTPSIGNWYASLPKPFFNPPNWIFAPVWTVLYFLMGISLYLVWNEAKRSDVGTGLKKKALWTFAFQLFLNVIWTAVFFGLENPAASFFVILALWLAIILTMIAFYRVSVRSVWPLLPYIAWVTFATILNYAIWQVAWVVH